MIAPSSSFTDQDSNFGFPDPSITKCQLVQYFHWHWCIFTACTEVLWPLLIGRTGDCLRPLLGKIYPNKKKNSTEEIGQWICGKICAERNISASFFSWNCLADTVWINWNVYFSLHDWSWNYIVFSLSLLALCWVFNSKFPIFLVVCCIGGRKGKVLDMWKMLWS